MRDLVVFANGTILLKSLPAATHGWVNAEFMLDNCMVGFLVPEPDPDSD